MTLCKSTSLPIYVIWNHRNPNPDPNHRNPNPDPNPTLRHSAVVRDTPPQALDVCFVSGWSGVMSLAIGLLYSVRAELLSQALTLTLALTLALILAFNPSIETAQLSNPKNNKRTELVLISVQFPNPSLEPSP